LYEHFKTAPFSANRLIEESQGAETFCLKNALEAVCYRGVSARSVGRYLSKIDGRIVNGLRLKMIPNKKHGATYRVEECEGFKPEQLPLDIWEATARAASVEPIAESVSGPY